MRIWTVWTIGKAEWDAGVAALKITACRHSVPLVYTRGSARRWTLQQECFHLSWVGCAIINECKRRWQTQLKHCSFFLWN